MVAPGLLGLHASRLGGSDCTGVQPQAPPQGALAVFTTLVSTRYGLHATCLDHGAPGPVTYSTAVSRELIRIGWPHPDPSGARHTRGWPGIEFQPSREESATDPPREEAPARVAAVRLKPARPPVKHPRDRVTDRRPPLGLQFADRTEGQHIVDPAGPLPYRALRGVLQGSHGRHDHSEKLVPPLDRIQAARVAYHGCHIRSQSTRIDLPANEMRRPSFWTMNCHQPNG